MNKTEELQCQFVQIMKEQGQPAMIDRLIEYFGKINWQTLKAEQRWVKRQDLIQGLQDDSQILAREDGEFTEDIVQIEDTLDYIRRQDYLLYDYYNDPVDSQDLIGIIPQLDHLRREFGVS